MSSVNNEYSWSLLLILAFACVVIISVSILVYKKLIIIKHKKLRDQKGKEQLEMGSDHSYDKTQREMESFYNTLRSMNEQIKKDPHSSLQTLQDMGLIDSLGQVIWKSENN